jgi:hypothetical protein
MLKGIAKTALAAAALAALSGCIIINADSDDARPDRGAKFSKADAYQSLIGAPATAIDRTALPSSFRIICHGCPATMDFREDRLTILLGPDDKVASVACN